jgi:HEAT repeat protein
MWRPSAVVLAFALFVARDAPADGGDTSAPASPSALLQRFGVDVARRLVHGDGSGEARADALRGIDRAAGIGTPDGVATLVQLLADPHGTARTDSVVLLAATRALAPFARQHPVGHALVDAVLNAPNLGAHPQSGDPPGPGPSDGDWLPRVELARQTAALALARAGETLATEALVGAAGRSGVAQPAALRALTAFPPASFPVFVAVTPDAIGLVSTIGDLRASDVVLDATRSGDRATRIAAIASLGAFGDRRGIPLATAAVDDPDPLVRQAAARALVDLEAPAAAKAVANLVGDDETATVGVALAMRARGEDVVGALASRVRASSDLALRKDAIAALGRQEHGSALTALVDMLRDPVLAGDAGEAIARSRASGAWPIVATILAQPSTRRLGARMVALRGRLVGAPPREVLRALHAMARSGAPLDRSVAVGALVLLGGDAAAWTRDPELLVRRAAFLSCEPTSAGSAALLGEAYRRETDPVTRLLLSRRLAVAGNDETTTELEDRVRAAGIDAPLAALTLARIGDDHQRGLIEEALASPDPLVRSHVARGLGESREPWALALLSEAYAVAIDTGARRAIVSALARRVDGADVVSRARVLDEAADFDPDDGIRAIADRARRGLPPPSDPAPGDVVWLRVMTDTGAPPPSPTAGVLLRSDGFALPVAFDDDGYALVPAPPGPARLVLAPRLPAYQAPAHGD